MVTLQRLTREFLLMESALEDLYQGKPRDKAKVVSQSISLLQGFNGSRGVVKKLGYYRRYRKHMLRVFEQLAPAVKNSKCSWQIKMAFRLVHLAGQSRFALMLMMLGGVIASPLMLLMYLQVKNPVLHELKVREATLCEPIEKIDPQSIEEVKKRDARVKVAPGNFLDVNLIQQYQPEDLFPVSVLLKRRNLKLEDCVFVSNSVRLSQILEASKLYFTAIHGSAVMDKNKEMSIYTELSDMFDKTAKLIEAMHFEGVPVVTLQNNELVTLFATTVALYNAIDLAIEKKKKHVVFIAEGDSLLLRTFIDKIAGYYLNNRRFICTPMHWLCKFEERTGQYSMVQDTRTVREYLYYSQSYDESVSDNYNQALINRCSSRYKSFDPFGLKRSYDEYYGGYFQLISQLKLIAEKNAKQDKRPILVVSQVDTKSIYWKALLPVVKSVLEKGEQLLFVTSHFQAYLDVEALGGTSIFFGNNIKTPNLSKYNLALNQIYMQMNSLSSYAIAELDIDKYQEFGKELIEDFWQALSSNYSFYEGLRRTITQVDVFNQIVDMLQPKSILAMPHVNPLSEVAIAVAKNKKILSVTMPSVTVDSNRRSIPLDWTTHIIASYGKQCTDAFKALGHEQCSIIETGNASLDGLINRRTEESIAQARQSIREEFGIDQDKKIIFIATSRIDREEHIWINEMINVADKRDDFAIILKPHPSFGLAAYSKVRISNNYFGTQSHTLDALLLASDVLVTDYSTTGAEAALFGMPVIVTNFTGEKYPSNNYDDYGVALLIEKLEQVEPVIASLFDDEKVQQSIRDSQARFAENYNVYNDGQASDRIGDILINPTNYTSSD